MRRVVTLTIPRATREQLQARLGLRRSNAAAPHRNKRKYTRTDKLWKREV